MLYPAEIIEEVRLANDIVDTVSSYVSLRQRGGNYIGLCPFHSEKTPSFTVSPDKQIFHCFGCGAGGNVISFIMRIENDEFTDALKFLADRARITLPEKNSADIADLAAKKAEREKVFDINTNAAKFFYENLKTPEGQAAVKYLDGRGVSRNARVKFGLGYAPLSRRSLCGYLKEEGYDEAFIMKAGLAAPDNSGGILDKFYGRLMFPIFEVTGKIVGFGGRVLGNSEPKYLNSPDTPVFSKGRNLYGIQLARKSKNKNYVLVEGYLDVISLFQAGFENTVAALGTSLTPWHARILHRYCDSAVLLFDGDEAGVKAALRAIPVLREGGLTVSVLRMTDAKDPDEYIQKFGGEKFAKLLESAEDHVAFEVNELKNAHDLSKSRERIKFTTEAAKVISKLDSLIEKDEYSRRISEMTGISASAITAEADLAEINGNSARDFIYERKTAGIRENGLTEAKKQILYWMAAENEISDTLKQYLAPEELGGVFGSLAQILYGFSGKSHINPGELCGYFEEPEDQQAVADIFKRDYSYENRDDLAKSLTSMLKVIKNAYIDEKILNASDDLPLLKKLMESKMGFQKLEIILNA